MITLEYIPLWAALLRSNIDIVEVQNLEPPVLSCRELMSGEVLLKSISKHQPITMDDIDSAYAHNQELRDLIYNRGI